jgi:hypothetical protein
MWGSSVTQSIQSFSAGWDPKRKTTSNHFVGIVEVLSGNSALMGFHNGSAQIQANAHAFRFCREKGFIEPVHDLGGQTAPCIGHREKNGVLLVNHFGNNTQFNMSLADGSRCIVNGLSCIFHQIDQYLFNQNGVDKQLG